MAFDNNDVEPSVEEAGPPPEPNTNRPFIIAAAILGGIMLLTLLCVAAYAFVITPRNRSASATQAALAIQQGTEVAQSVKFTQLAQLWTATPTLSKATRTSPPPTATPVLANPTKTPTQAPPTTELRTATVSALLTQAAAAKTASPVVTTTALPPGGFADEVGAPALMGMALALVMVIFLARRMRSA